MVVPAQAGTHHHRPFDEDAGLAFQNIDRDYGSRPAPGRPKV